MCVSVALVNFGLGVLIKRGSERTVPQFRIHAIKLEKLAVRSDLHHFSVLEHQNLVTVIDCAEPVRYKHTRPTLLAQNAVDVL